MSRTLSRLKREGGISLKTPQQKRASSCVEGRISWFFSSSGRKLEVPLEIRRGAQGPAHVASGKCSVHANCEGPLRIPLQSVSVPKSSSGAKAATSGFLSSADMDLGFLWSFCKGVKPRLVWKHASLLSSRAGKAVSGFLSC